MDRWSQTRRPFKRFLISVSAKLWKNKHPTSGQFILNNIYKIYLNEFNLK